MRQSPCLAATLLVSGCAGAPPQAFHDSYTRSLGAKPAIAVEYMASIDTHDRGPRSIIDEQGVYKCAQTFKSGITVGQPPSPDCPPELLHALGQSDGILLFSNGTPHRLTKENFESFFGAIDSEEKAHLYAVELLGLSVVGPGGIRRSQDGFELLVDSSEGGGECHVESTTKMYRSIYVMNARGETVQRSKHYVDSFTATDECHPRGRRPSSFTDLEVAATFQGYGQRAAHREAASVDAFHELARSLMRFDAPESLVRRCRRAAYEEQKHAASWRALSMDRPRGAARQVAPPADTLEDLAIENAVEGILLEGFAARLAAAQATRARDPRVRRTLAALVEEEMSHHALSCDVNAWAVGGLGTESKRRVRDEHDHGAAELARRLGSRARSPIDDVMGEPSPKECLELLSY